MRDPALFFLFGEGRPKPLSGHLGMEHLDAISGPSKAIQRGSLDDCGAISGSFWDHIAQSLGRLGAILLLQWECKQPLLPLTEPAYVI